MKIFFCKKEFNPIAQFNKDLIKVNKSVFVFHEKCDKLILDFSYNIKYNRV